MKRVIPFLGGLLVLCACGPAAEGTAFSTVIDRFQGSEVSSRFASAAEADAPVLQVGFVDQELGTNLRLERRNGAYTYWISSDGAQLILQDGMLHGTRGIGEGLLASDLTEPLERLGQLQAGPSNRFHTYLNGNDQAVTRTYRCEFRRTREITISVVGGEIGTVLFREKCNSLDQAFENLYWVDPRTRQIVQSRQWAGPRVGAISTRIVLE